MWNHYNTTFGKDVLYGSTNFTTYQDSSQLLHSLLPTKANFQIPGGILPGDYYGGAENRYSGIPDNRAGSALFQLLPFPENLQMENFRYGNEVIPADSDKL